MLACQGNLGTIQERIFKVHRKGHHAITLPSSKYVYLHQYSRFKTCSGPTLQEEQETRNSKGIPIISTPAWVFAAC
jgi:hypothetical protein